MISRLIFDALETVGRHWLALIRVTAIPGLLIGFPLAAGILTASPMLVVPYMLMVIPMMVMMGITLHRFVLLGPQSVPHWGLAPLGRREIRFARALLLFMLILSPCYLLEEQPLAWLGILLSVYLTGRLSMVFPSIAIDREITLKQSWEMTAQHQFPVMLTVGLFPVLLWLPVEHLGAQPDSQWIVLLLSHPIGIVTSCLLSKTYAYLIARPGIALAE